MLFQQTSVGPLAKLRSRPRNPCNPVGLTPGRRKTHDGLRDCPHHWATGNSADEEGSPRARGSHPRASGGGGDAAAAARRCRNGRLSRYISVPRLGSTAFVANHDARHARSWACGANKRVTDYIRAPLSEP